jgi:cytochrome c5
MKKLITIVMISVVVFACSHKTTSTVTKTEITTKTESAMVSNAQYLEGKLVFETKCGKCHKLKDPARGNMTQWTKWIDKMAVKAKLTPEQKMQVTNFISVNALSN